MCHITALTGLVNVTYNMMERVERLVEILPAPKAKRRSWQGS